VSPFHLSEKKKKRKRELLISSFLPLALPYMAGEGSSLSEKKGSPSPSNGTVAARHRIRGGSLLLSRRDGMDGYAAW